MLTDLQRTVLLTARERIVALASACGATERDIPAEEVISLSTLLANSMLRCVDLSFVTRDQAAALFECMPLPSTLPLRIYRDFTGNG